MVVKIMCCLLFTVINQNVKIQMQPPILQPVKSFYLSENPVDIKKLNNRIFIQTQSGMDKQWYEISDTLQKLNISHEQGINLISFCFYKNKIFFLCKKSPRRYFVGVKVANSISSLDNMKTISLSLDFYPSRIFVVDDHIFLGHSDLHKKEKYFFHQYSFSGKFIDSFAPAISLPDTIPFFSVYYLASTNYFSGMGFIVTYKNLPNIFIFNKAGKMIHKYFFSNIAPAPSFYSYDPNIKFGMQIPKQHLLGQPAVDESGDLWLPVIKRNNGNTFSELYQLKKGRLQEKYMIKKLKITAIEFSNDFKILYAVSQHRLSIFRLKK